MASRTPCSSFSSRVSHPEAERLPVHVDGTAQVAAGDADVIEAGQQR